MSTEFNSNISINSISQPTTSKPAAEKEQAVVLPAENNEIQTSQGNLVGQSAIAGKSQIKADNIANDMLTFCSNPKAVELSDKFFDKAYAALVAEKDPNAYEKACLMTAQFVAECVKK